MSTTERGYTNRRTIYAPQPQAAYGLLAEVVAHAPELREFAIPARPAAPSPEVAAERTMAAGGVVQPEEEAAAVSAAKERVDKDGPPLQTDKGKGVDRAYHQAPPAPQSPSESELYWADQGSWGTAGQSALDDDRQEDPETPKATHRQADPLATPTTRGRSRSVYLQKGKKRVRIETPTPSPGANRTARTARRGRSSEHPPIPLPAMLPQPSWLSGPGMEALAGANGGGDGAGSLRAMQTGQETQDGRELDESAGQDGDAETEDPMRM